MNDINFPKQEKYKGKHTQIHYNQNARNKEGKILKASGEKHYIQRNDDIKDSQLLIRNNGNHGTVPVS